MLKFLLILTIQFNGHNGYVVLDDSFKTMQQCIAEMNRLTYVRPEEERKRFGCITVTEMIVPE
jgi:hypothetical protein